MSRIAAIVVGLLLVLCGLAAAGGLAYFFFLVPRAEAQPVVLIGAPGQGDEVQVGEAVLVQASARDQTGVVRVELWVDGQLEESRGSSLPEGSSHFPLLARWEPSSPGTHTLAVRAFNANDARAYVALSVEAVEVPDRDGDGVADEGDTCPDEAGSGTAAGCPDADGDGVVDAEDACPSEVGTAEGGGCPLAVTGDRDGDGLPDESDACPDEPGLQAVNGCPDADGDGVADRDDACPSEAGVREVDGCPGARDLDGDGVSDEDDDCPAQPGLPELGGCPDTDGDGVRDPDDLRPEEPGDPGNHGAPGTGAPDSDGDGLADDVDRCDDEAGSVEHEGCPPPGEGEDLDEDGTSDEDQGADGAADPVPELGGEPELAVVEVEGLEFLLGQQYDEVTCYIGVGDYYEQYGPYELEGGTRWDIATDVGGQNSVVVEVPGDEPLEVFLECEAYVGDEPPLNLGTYRQEHDREEWIGSRLGGRSEREEEPSGATFLVYYRICEGSCEESSLPAPVARLEHTWINEELVDTQVVWSWTGDEEAIHHFGIYYTCGDRAGALLHATPQERRISVHWIDPHCNETCEFQVAGYRMGGLMLTPRSNRVAWNGEECARGRSVMIDLETFRPIPAVDGRGPIYGDFYANGELLTFDGAGEAYCGFYDYECGYYVHYVSDGYLTVGELFNTIRQLESGCSACTYVAPSSTSLTVSLPEGEALRIGFDIWEYHREGTDVLLCSGESTFQYDETRNIDGYVWPSYDIVVPCRVEVSMRIWTWPGG